jgi:hypothetical protein
MARAFGGWHPTGLAESGAAGLVCVAPSGGQGPDARGWPDALAAGPWCARASGAAGNPGAPTRALAPVDGPSPLSPAVGGARPARDAVPVLLVPPRGAMTTEVAGLLAGAFEPAGTWCSGSVDAPCVEPGFAVIFGGSAAVRAAVARDLDRLVSGGQHLGGEVAPSLGSAFWTELDLRPVYRQGGEAPDFPGQVCWRLGALDHVRWLAIYGDDERTRFLAARDAAADRLYFRPDRAEPATSLPACVPAPTTEDDRLVALGVSLSGHVTTPQPFDRAPGSRVRLDAAVEQSGPPAQESPSGRTWRFEGEPEAPVVLEVGREAHPVVGAALTLTLDEGSRVGGAVPATGEALLQTAAGAALATIGAEAVLVDGRWEARGEAVLRLPDGRVAAGGFTATVTDASGGAVVRWRLDGLAR